MAYDVTPTRGNMLKGYCILSRVQSADGLLIAQPYAPMLFRQGPLPGPHLLMEVLRGNLPGTELEAAWKRAESERAKLKTDLKSMKWACAACKKGKGFLSSFLAWFFCKRGMNFSISNGINKFGSITP